MSQLSRIFINDNNTIKFNINPETLSFYYYLTIINELIDEKHDQLDSGRGNDLKSKDKKYKEKLITAINISTIGSISEFFTGINTSSLRRYNVNNSVHTLEDALKRQGDSFEFNINNQSYTSPALPSLMILPWKCNRNADPDNLNNCTVIYKNFSTPNGCNNVIAGNLIKNDTLTQSDGVVVDAGSKELFKAIVNNGDDNRNYISGKLDSSSVSDPINQEIANIPVKVLIPFMNIYGANGSLMGIIMVYAVPNITSGGYNVKLAFKYISAADYSSINSIN
jgi:hypothetical protein